MIRTILAVFTISISLQIQASSNVEGIWAGPSGLIEIREADSNLSMTVIALLEPLDENGIPVTDQNNPEPELRTRPIIGLQLLSQMALAKQRWEGKIYDPESGNTYSARVRVKNGQLEMRGYIGTPMFGRTVTYRPVSTCDEEILTMLANSKMEGVCT